MQDAEFGTSWYPVDSIFDSNRNKGVVTGAEE